MTANDIIQRNAECARQLLEAGAEIEMLRAADKVRVTVHEAEIRRLAIECGKAKDEIERLTGLLQATITCRMAYGP